MHKISLLSEVSDVYEFCYHLLNNYIFCSYLFFHDIFPIPPILSLIYFLFASATNLSFASLDNLSNFVLLSAFNFLLCISILIFLGFSQSPLMFLAPLCPCVHLIMSLHYQHWYYVLWPLYHGCKVPILLPFIEYTFVYWNDMFIPSNSSKCGSNHFC